MYSVEECRKRARQCVEQAQSCEGADKHRVLKLANDWLTVADEQQRVERLSERSCDPVTQSSAVSI